LEQWITEFLQHINEVNPKFVALHLQEVGGKTYEKSLEHVARFIKVLCESKELEDFDRVRIYLDEDFSSAEHFTVSERRQSSDDDN
jgi:inositol polyphosphate 5-phosphatase INPP5A